MGRPSSKSRHRPRELRRRVLLPVRVRSGQQWTNARIADISSRGLMVQWSRAAPEGSLVELRRGAHRITATVVWCKHGRAGLSSDERLPVEEMLSEGHIGSLTLVNCAARKILPGSPDVTSDARLQSRLMQFLSTVGIALGLAAGLTAMAAEAFAQPLAQVEAALSG